MEGQDPPGVVLEGSCQTSFFGAAEASRHQRKVENTMSFAEHRERLYQTLAENTLVIAYAGIPIHTNEDDYYDFAVNSQYFYLTGLERQNTAFLAYKTAEKTREILFIEEPDPLSERWTGKMPTKEEVRSASGSRMCAIPTNWKMRSAVLWASAVWIRRTSTCTAAG